MCKTHSLWRRLQLDSRCFEPLVFLSSSAQHRRGSLFSCAKLQAVLLLTRGSIHPHASFMIYFPLYLYCYTIPINITKEEVVIDHDKSVNSVGKCIQYCLLLNRKWVVIFLLNYSDNSSLWLRKRQFNIIYACAF